MADSTRAFITTTFDPAKAGRVLDEPVWFVQRFPGVPLTPVAEYNTPETRWTSPAEQAKGDAFGFRSAKVLGAILPTRPADGTVGSSRCPTTPLRAPDPQPASSRPPCRR